MDILFLNVGIVQSFGCRDVLYVWKYFFKYKFCDVFGCRDEGMFGIQLCLNVLDVWMYSGVEGIVSI